MNTIKVPFLDYFKGASEVKGTLLFTAFALWLLEWVSINMWSVTMQSTTEEAFGASVLSAATSYLKLFVICLSTASITRHFAKKEGVSIGLFSVLSQLVKSFAVSIVAVAGLFFMMSSIASVVIKNNPEMEQGMLILFIGLALIMFFILGYFVIIYQQYLRNAVLKKLKLTSAGYVNGYKVPFVAFKNTHKILPVYLMAFVIVVLQGTKGALIGSGYFLPALVVSALPSILFVLLIVKNGEHVFKVPEVALND